MNLEQIFTMDPYCLPKTDKQKFLLESLTRLTNQHKDLCLPYHNILKALPTSLGFESLDQIPMLPVRLFKMHELRSVPRDTVIKVLTSSGTTSQVVSRIFLDKETSILQTKALVNIVKSFIGGQRLPMIIVDHPNVIKDRTSFSARGAGMMGLINFGRDHFYLLDEDMNINWDGLSTFIDKHHGEKILLFGFTFMVWKYFYEAALLASKKIDLGDSILIHSGGWKKLQESAVDNDTFKRKLKEQLGIQRIHNFYGMVEQVGSIYMECEHGFLHAPNYADIITLGLTDLKPQPYGAQGLIQTVSVLPKSYPGHSLLTEDLGTVFGEDDCPCGRMGKYFKIHGRLPAAELRGCSDTHAYDRR